MRGKNQNGYQYSRDSNLIRSSKDFGSYVCYMTSSSDEISAFVPSCTYEQQVNDIKHLITWGSKYSINIVVRHHPNLGRIGRPNDATLFLAKVLSLQAPNLFVIEPESSLNTYSLAFGSIFSLCPQSTLSLDLPILGFNVVVLTTVMLL